MFTSDVSARGVDYPDVTLVMQVGSTERESYIHRLGRTARASSGVEGRGIMITSPVEIDFFLKQTKGFPVTETPWLEPSPTCHVRTSVDEYLKHK